MTADAPDAAADRVVLRYAPVTDRVTEELSKPRYAAYLRRAKSGPVAVGDEWEGFVSRGCGATADVTLTVAGVESGDRVGEATEFELVPATGDDGGESATGDGD